MPTSRHETPVSYGHVNIYLYVYNLAVYTKYLKLSFVSLRTMRKYLNDMSKFIDFHHRVPQPQFYKNNYNFNPMTHLS